MKRPAWQMIVALTGVCWVAGNGPAGAQDGSGDNGVISLTSENDLFGGTDRNYSNGLRVERVSRGDEVFGILDSAADLLPFIDIERRKLRQGFGLSHAIFTPEDITLDTPPPDDRPYAAWLNVSATAIASEGNTQDSLQLNFGVVGPLALGDFVQTNWHRLINGKEPRGWDTQIRNEPGLELIAQRMTMADGPDLPFGLETDLGLHFGAALGNVRTYGATGGMMRIGMDLDADFGPPRIRPALSGAGVFTPRRGLGGYAFMGIEGRVVGRDIFLDGNTFRDSANVDDRRTLVADIQAGLALHYRKTQVAFTYVHRTEEFVNQAGPQRFGAVSISIAR